MSGRNYKFPCFPSLPDFSSAREPLMILWGGETNDEEKCNKRKQEASILKLDASSGALQLPQYQAMPRDTCPLLRHAWSQNWDKVIYICALEPHRALHKTQHSGRTALHLATFNRRCPLSVARALLTANRHMILVQDSNRYTPLHIVAFFSSVKPTPNTDEDYHDMRQIKEQRDEESRLMDLFCATAIMVEQELQNTNLIPPAYGTSPLFLAAKRNAPLAILQTLLHTRHRTSWMAPSTGGEPYWDSQTLDEYSSPLEVLLRDSNRASKYLNADNLQTNPKLVQNLRTVALTRLSRKRGTHVGHEGHQHQDLGDHDAILLWEKCIELLAGHIPLLEVGDDLSHVPYGILHSVVSCKVPIPLLVQAALIVFPEQAFQRDEQGMIPLHHVLFANHKYATTQLLNILLPGTKAGEMGKKLHSTVLFRFPNNGPTPLAYALKQELAMDPVIKKLLEAERDVSLCTKDPSTRLYPFCLAALPAKNNTSRDTKTSTEYALEESGEIKDRPTSETHETTILSCRYLERLDLTFQLLVTHPQVLSLCMNGEKVY